MNLAVAEKLAHDLMAAHNVPASWKFKWDRARQRFGFVNYTRRVMSLSMHLAQLNDERHVRNTILHEIAHILVGPGHHHDEVWRLVAKSIGCTGDRCYGPEVVLAVGLVRVRRRQRMRRPVVWRDTGKGRK